MVIMMQTSALNLPWLNQCKCLTESAEYNPIILLPFCISAQGKAAFPGLSDDNNPVN